MGKKNNKKKAVVTDISETKEEIVEELEASSVEEVQEPVEEPETISETEDSQKDQPARKIKKWNGAKVKDLFGDKPVTRKFLAIALALGLLLNAAFTTGLLALFSHDNDNQADSGGSNESEQYYDNYNGHRGPGNGMAPPDEDWNHAPWDDQQNSSGVSIGIVITDHDGVYVTQVSGTNATKAGFEIGDKILTFDGTDISTSNDLITEVQKHASGDKVTVKVERNGKTVKIKTTLE